MSQSQVWVQKLPLAVVKQLPLEQSALLAQLAPRGEAVGEGAASHAPLRQTMEPAQSESVVHSGAGGVVPPPLLPPNPAHVGEPPASTATHWP